ncbi:MAG: BlaI family transcriptional regulator [Lachnospiraceae bacterium]|jgi:predicted transcriptional regulator|nr:BlaI family transcriptional regulator [Lachnospiraceae bacterium]
MKLFDSELKVMNVLWREGDLRAGKIAKILKDEVNWNRNTSYTVIKKCVEKGAIERYGVKFMCRAIVSREEAQQYETNELVEKMFEGSYEKFFAAFLNEGYLTDEEIERLKKIVDDGK